MRPERESRPWQTTVGLFSAGILFASLTWGTVAIGEEKATPHQLYVGEPVAKSALRDSRGQGLNAPIIMPQGDVDIISVILWDEAQRPPAPPIGPSATGLGSTVNGTPY
jgi:hypothetical protein